MPSSRLHLDPGGRPARRPSFATGGVALAALTALALLQAGACSGEQALSSRDASALAGVGGTAGAAGKGGTSTPGTGGSVGDAGAGGSGGDTGGAVGSAGTSGDAGTAGTSAGAAGTSGGASAGRGGAGGSATAGTGGSARGGAGGTAGMSGVGGRQNGTSCTKGSDCGSTYCFDNVCCASDCTGTCRTCNGASPGTCVFAPDGTDPRDQCPMDTPTSCGHTGMCNGSGSCRYYGATQICNSMPSCDDTNSSIVSMKACNGAGTCAPMTTQSCNGFRCVPGAQPTCGTTCTADAACAGTGFCSAATCVVNPNLAGNGDLETGMPIGWQSANGGGGVLGLSAVASGGVSHTGGYSIYLANRGYAYQGPGYSLPTGPGKYTISGWAMQKDLPSVSGAVQIRLDCQTNINPGYYVPVGTFGLTMMQNVWVQFSGTVDTSLAPAGTDCLPDAATPGQVRRATLYLNHTADTTAPFPDMYFDDLVVQVPDAHNLVGNPNFENGGFDGWTVSTGSATPSVASVGHGTSTHSLRNSARSVPATGPRYALPTGAARYDFSFWVKHTGTMPHDLMLVPTYSCITPAAPVTLPAVAAALAAAPDTWTALTGTVTLPPADAPAGCQLTMAAVYVRTEGTACGAGTECPDLYVDDASISLR
jgi:hypothetical protein